MLLIGTENPVGFRVDSPGFDMDLEREGERDGVFCFGLSGTLKLDRF